MKNKLCLIFIMLLSSGLASAAVDVCKFSARVHVNTKIQTGKHGDGSCYISISPSEMPDLVYRSHVFTTKGLHQVFNSFGTGPIKTSTGARVFYYHMENPDLKLKLYQEHILIDFSEKLKIIINAKTTTIRKKSIGIRYLESPIISSENDGGVEILKSATTFFDFGFRLGSSPLTDLSREHTIYFDNGKLCRSENDRLLRIENYNVYWNFNGFNDVETYLNANCSRF